MDLKGSREITNDQSKTPHLPHELLTTQKGIAAIGHQGEQ
jgi:hypothetical protein